MFLYFSLLLLLPCEGFIFFFLCLQFFFFLICSSLISVKSFFFRRVIFFSPLKLLITSDWEQVRLKFRLFAMHFEFCFHTTWLSFVLYNCIHFFFLNGRKGERGQIPTLSFTYSSFQKYHLQYACIPKYQNTAIQSYNPFFVIINPISVGGTNTRTDTCFQNWKLTYENL